ncbi:hypothetical protein WJX82_010068 [Trebouxia sp. C0006]
MTPGPTIHEADKVVQECLGFQATSGHSRQIRRALESLRFINTAGLEWKTFNAAQKQARRDMLPLYQTKRPLLAGRFNLNASQHSFGPMFTVQIVEVGYLIYCGRYFYPVLVLLLFTISAVLLVHTLRRQRKKIMALPGKALCDMVLMQGTCLVMESMLSGEAAQVRKSSYVPEKGMDYDPDKNHTCTVYAGTVVQQVWNAQDPQAEVLVMVVRTGLNTTMGNMVRELLAPTKRAMKSDPFLADVFHLYAFALVLQIFIHIPYFAKAAAFKQTPDDVLRKIIDIMLYAVPVGVPTVMLLIGRIAYQRLAKEKIALMFPESLKVGALADVVCFDKTGTLTHSVTELAGVLPVHKGEFQAIQQSALRWSNRLKQAVAVCNSLTMVNKNTVVGADMERSMFKAVEARFLDREHVVLPRQPDHTSEALLAKLSIAKVMDFTSQTLRSGVVVWSDDGPRGSALLFLRGAPAVIRDMVQPNTVPQDFNQVMDDYSSKSFRLLAMAMGVIPNAVGLDFAVMTQLQVEACAEHMQLLSLVVLTNNVRCDSKDTITHLQDGGGLRTVMITGDYHHTAVAVARDVGMVKPDGRVVVIDTAHSEVLRDDQSAAQTPDIGFSAASSPLSTPQVSFQRRNADFAHGFFAQSFKPRPGVSVSKINRAFAPTWDSADGPMSDPYDLQRAPLKGLVFTSGTGSHYVMEPCEAITSMAEGSMRGIHQHFEGQPRYIQGLGNTTIFCGDGINDLAALSAADVGMSIGATDAVIAAALSTPQGSVAGVCSFIRTGKASHAMMVSLFKYMVVYQCVLATANVAAFCVDGSSTSNLQSGAIDAQAMSLALAACLVPPLPKLNRHKLAERMCTMTVLARIFCMTIAFGALDMSYSVYLVTRPWFAGGTGTAYMNPVITLGWFFGNQQLLAPLVSLTIDTKPYCESPLSTKPLLVMSVVLPTLAFLVLLTDHQERVSALVRHLVFHKCNG